MAGPRRSRDWFSGPEYYAFARRAWLRSEGLGHEVFDGRPVIGIANSASELNNCNLHLHGLAAAVKRGVLAAGGLPLEFPTISTGEMLMKPTAMLYRNLMAIDVEESIRAYPLDGVVLLCGCDKTTPAQLMGAASAGVPAIVVTGGPMLGGLWRGQRLGSSSDGRKLFDRHRAGDLSDEQLCEIEGGLARSPGHCTVMGTASTMAAMAEALGMTLPGAAAIPAVDARRAALAEASGRRIVAMVDEALTPDRLMTRAAFENAITLDMALAGSTNAVVHLLAIAGRLGVPLSVDDFDTISRRTPFLANVKPSGEHLMEDFFAAGGVPAVLAELTDLLHLDALTANGHTLGENVAAAECWDRDVIRPRARPLHPEGGTAVLYGNVAPRSALIKPTAASPALLRHRGPAYVFESREQLYAEIDRDDLPVTPETVLALRNAGPVGGPGFPEWGQIPIPRRLLREGVTDMVRISDARMSGTSFGTVVLHIAPEAAVGGPLAVVRTGDEIVLDVEARRIDVALDDAETARRLAAFVPPPPAYERGWGKLYLEHVTQADEGCDLDFLRGGSSAADRPQEGRPARP